MNDTIAAISTPLGTGAIGIIRISGRKAISIAEKIFLSPNRISLKNAKSHTIHYGYIRDSANKAKKIDHALFTVMKGPHTYTGEDIVEISTHGNRLILNKTLELILNLGARLAEGGEFTKRAFLNNKMDLIQAESVIELLKSQTEEQLDASLDQLEGKLSENIRTIQQDIYNIFLSIEASIDFPEEETVNISYTELINELKTISNNIKVLIASYNKGHVIEDGFKVAIIGRFNSGKSSLFNILVEQKDRVIVSPYAGTTRDRIEEAAIIHGRLFKFVDTAGFKVPKDMVEEKSIDQTYKAIKDADLCLFVIDNSAPFDNDDMKIIQSKPSITVINKKDLKSAIDPNKIHKISDESIETSCKTYEGITQLKDKIYAYSETLLNKNIKTDIILTNIRHKHLLEQCINNLSESITALNSQHPIEFISSCIKKSLLNIQEITGDHFTENLLDDIFENFCIGK